MIYRILTLIRENEGITPHETAQRLGLSSEAVMDYECGRVVPNKDVIARYSKAFGVPVSSIAFFSEADNDGILTQETRLFFADKIVKLVETLMKAKK